MSRCSDFEMAVVAVARRRGSATHMLDDVKSRLHARDWM